jgi:hypothetical protein
MTIWPTPLTWLGGSLPEPYLGTTKPKRRRKRAGSVPTHLPADPKGSRQ